MITAVLAFEHTKFSYLEVSGHAGYAPKGSDIVCSAVSAVTVGGLNALSEPERYKIEVDDGYFLLKVKETPSQHDIIVIDTMIIQLESIAESYPKYAKLERKHTE